MTTDTDIQPDGQQQTEHDGISPAEPIGVVLARIHALHKLTLTEKYESGLIDSAELARLLALNRLAAA
jgi:hypothetical protein